MNEQSLQIPENTTKNTHNVVAELLAEENNCKVVLDIPCGAGAFTKRSAEAGFEIFAADCENILQFPHENFSVADMNARLAFPDETFDAVVCIDGIEHIEKPFDFIRECHRIIRTGGTLTISTPNLMSLRSRWRWFLTGFHQGEKIPLDESHPTPLHHISLVSFTDLRYRLHVNGFRVVAVRTNRTRWIANVYGIFAPFSYLMTRWVFRKEGRKLPSRDQNRKIFNEIFSAPILFGETLIVKAVRE